MLTLSLDHIQKIDTYKNVLQQILNKNNQTELQEIQTALQNNQQGWLQLPETVDYKSINEYAQTVKGKYKHIVILGIGGSALGITALREALLPLHWNELPASQRNHKPTLHVLDNIDPALINAVEQIIDIKQTLFIVISKSGRTPETASQYMYFRKKVTDQRGQAAVAEHFLFITDPEQGVLRADAKELGITTFPIPQNVGGRFSVLTAVGLVPAALLGMNIHALLTGAASAREAFLHTPAEHNNAYLFAKLQHQLKEKHSINMTCLMPYSNRLFTIADWYRQLLAESIGKEKNRTGATVTTGITPINALGATDQHSQVQLYTEGPKDKLLVIISSQISHSQQVDQEQTITTGRSDDFSYLNTVSFKELLETERQATTDALTKYKTPTVSLKITDITEETIGNICMFFQIATGILGELYNIDAYNQPGVELGKVLTKKYLQK